MRSFEAEFRLEPTADHPAPAEAAHDLSEALGGDWRVFQEPDTGGLWLVTEGDDGE